MNQDQYKSVHNWIYRNARPLDLARWQYHFEGGSKEAVVNCLTAYQNVDGGFGHALEADAWNPNSSPIQTFHALEILREIGFTDREHKLVQGILSYLSSGKDMEGDVWFDNIPSNNEYPHAPWWQVGSESLSHDRFNPTAGLAGFVLCYGEKDCRRYEQCLQIAKDGLAYLLQTKTINMHVLMCFIAMLEYCEQAELTDSIDLVVLKHRLGELVRETITMDTDSWATSYVCKPSNFLNSPDSPFFSEIKEVAEFEADFIENNRNHEGVWEVTWGWGNYPDEWAISKTWWKGHIAIKNMLYLKNFNKI